ncbi:hypothetical protein [Litchfieldella xinjiangensis]|uniref:hypothetical protein n=1 Tax=Litchfieldella xinjiangensis TaxID=1166948 RepID=UPI0005BDEEDF|nr:hypothetical protein [Halomonas xinjiangensis]
MRLWLMTTALGLALGLAGCASGPATLPERMSAPVEACQWPSSLSGNEANKRVVAALEAQGFSIQHTETTLGLVSAERQQTVPGYDSYHDPHDPWPMAGWFGHYAFGLGSRGGSGVVIGFNQRAGTQAQRIERVSVVVDGERIQVTRDIQTVGGDGSVREGGTASTAPFCRELRGVLESSALDADAPESGVLESQPREGGTP